METLLEQFNNMHKMPIIELQDETTGEWDYWTIYADLHGIRAIGTDLFIKWDETFSLDEHLESLFEKLMEAQTNGEI